MDQDRLLEVARDAWRAAAPTDAEIQRGAARVSARLGARGSSRARRRIFVAVGACAAFLAALAYAGTQKWIESPRGVGPRPSEPVASPTHEAVVESPPSHQVAPVKTPAAEPAQPDGPPIQEPPRVHSEPVVPVVPTSPTATEDRSPRRPAGSTDTKAPAVANGEVREPSWAEVGDALSSSDEKRAESLLSDLARHGHDANSRAKAKLGLAQLEASHGNCAKARVLALQVAAVEGIELKTVRRALELAAHCTQ